MPAIAVVALAGGFDRFENFRRNGYFDRKNFHRLEASSNGGSQMIFLWLEQLDLVFLLSMFP
mgnify:CR=1 FL=1